MLFISDMPLQSEVQITASVKDYVVTFNTEIIGIYPFLKQYGHGVYCKPVMRDGKCISFKGVSVTVEILNKEDHRIYKYNCTVCSHNQDKDKLIICSQQQQKPINNRSAFRLPCGYRAVLQLAAHRGTVEGFIHDISVTGASCLFKVGVCQATIGECMTATVYEDNSERQYKISGTIVRIDEDYAPEKLLIGVKFDSTDYGISKLVASLQMKELRVRGSSR